METSTSSTRSSKDLEPGRGGHLPPRLLLAVAIAAAGLLTAAELRGAAPPPGPYAAGDGRAFAYSFEFGAVRSELTGGLRGRGTFGWNRRPRGSIRIRVTCLAVDGKTAVVGGEITRRTGRRVSKSMSSAAFTVEDRTAEGRADRISRLQLRSGPASCGSQAQAALGTLRSGDIAVSGGGPEP